MTERQPATRSLGEVGGRRCSFQGCQHLPSLADRGNALQPRCFPPAGQTVAERCKARMSTVEPAECRLIARQHHSRLVETRRDGEQPLQNGDGGNASFERRLQPPKLPERLCVMRIDRQAFTKTCHRLGGHRFLEPSDALP